MSQIKDYLEQGRAGKVYDPNQGLYMDPASGKAFVPTFTNVQNSNIQGEVESQMGGASRVQADPYLVSDKGQGAMPGPQEPAGPLKPDGRDPWAMAQEHTKSPEFKNEVYREMFGRDPQSGFRDEAERNRFYAGLKSARNIIVDRLKWQIDRKDRQEKESLKSAAKKMSHKEMMDSIIELKEKYKTMQDEDAAGWEMRYGGKSPEDMAKQEFLDNIKLMESLYSDVDKKGGSGMPGREESGGAIDMGKPEPDSPKIDFRKLEPGDAAKAYSWATKKAQETGADPKALLRGMTQADLDEATGKKPAESKAPANNNSLNEYDDLVMS